MPKKLSIYIIAVALSLLASIVPTLSLLAQPGQIRHEDPETIANTTDLITLFAFYLNTFERAYARQYRDAGSMLDELKYANVPAEFRYGFDQYNELSRELFDSLNRAEVLLNEASSLVAGHRADDARQKLDEAESILNSAESVMSDLETVIARLDEVFRIASRGTTSSVWQAFSRMRSSLVRLREIIGKLNQFPEDIENNKAVITSFYYQTFLQASAPANANPGLPVTVSGEVHSAGVIINRAVKVLLDGAVVGETITSGDFRFTITPPPDITEGWHTISVTAVPYERHIGTTWASLINITRLPLNISLEMPSLIIALRPFQVTGNVRQDAVPVANAGITLTLHNSKTISRTAADGSFAATVKTPLMLSSFGPQQLTIVAQPAQPWLSAVRTQRWVFIVSPANAGLVLLALIALGMVTQRWRNSRRARSRADSGLSSLTSGLAGATVDKPMSSRPGTSPESDDIRNKVLAAYRSGARLVARATGTGMTPQITLREFATAVTPRLAEAGKAFIELTDIAEIVLYSALPLETRIQTRADQLAATIEKELHGTA